MDDIEDLVGRDDVEMKSMESQEESRGSTTRTRKHIKPTFKKPPPRSPKVEVLELTDDHIKFVLSETDVSIANSLRRVMISEVPTIAIDKVTIEENSSVLSDDFLAHRIGLVPLQSSSVSRYNYNRECNCNEGCDNCVVKYHLNIKHTDGEGGNRDVHASELVCDSEEATVYPVGQDNGVLLVKLGVNQELKLTANAYKGIGKEHAKWSPCAVATYQFDPDVTIDRGAMDQLDEDKKREFAEVCPTKVFAYREESRTVIVEDAPKCTYCKECKWKAKEWNMPGLVTVKPKPGRFVFTVETTGHLKPQEIVLSALQQLKEKLTKLETELQTVGAQSNEGDYAKF
jgi:DNA-directed RNA polymerase II subunit RPB3